MTRWGLLRRGVVAKQTVEAVLFSTKWVLLSFYFGLMVALVFYGAHFTRELWHFVSEWRTIGKDGVLMGILELLDMVMIANLVKMIATGSYTTFIDKTPNDTSERTSSGILKVKMATSLMGVTSIHLLQTLVNSEHASREDIVNQVVIFMAFSVAALVLAVVDRLHHSSGSPSGH